MKYKENCYMERIEIINEINEMKEMKILSYLPMKSDNYLKEWLEYKFPKLVGRKDSSDLDVSKKAIITYGLELFAYKKEKSIFSKISKQSNNSKKYCINYIPELRGDWLTSPLHMIKLYMGLLWEDNMCPKEFKNLFSRVTKKHMLYSPEGFWEEYVYKNADKIWNNFDYIAKEFIKNTVSMGNFIMMPIYINPCRCKAFAEDDTLDTLLWKMYCCFELKRQEKENELSEYLINSFKGDDEIEARNNVIRWMNLYNNDWQQFIKYNYLQDTVVSRNGKFERPIDLRKGHDILCELYDTYEPLPNNLNLTECLQLMKNYNNYISKRTKRIDGLIKTFDTSII